MAKNAGVDPECDGTPGIFPRTAAPTANRFFGEPLDCLALMKVVSAPVSPTDSIVTENKVLIGNFVRQ
jgi:hypothetical protein